MSFTELMMSMDDEVAVSQSTSSSKKVVWTREMERKFLNLLHDQVHLGRKGEGGFKTEAWTAIERKFNADLNLNLSKENFKNKLKGWKQGFRVMRELKNMSGFAWNEDTQSVDADDMVWEELLKRKEFKSAKVYKRQPFQYYNDLAIIVGNDIAEGVAATTAAETEEGLNMDGPAYVDCDEDVPMSTPLNTTTDLDDELCHSNQSSASRSQNPSTSSPRRAKRKKASIIGSMDVLCDTMKRIEEDFRAPLVFKVDCSDSDAVLRNVYEALRAIPDLSPQTMIKAYDTFTAEKDRAKGFLQMNDEERLQYIAVKFTEL